jgi:class 3 adenylate cyclase
MARFGLDALRVIEDVNVKLSAALSINIGVNSGGPILGTDKPTFDIIGGAINIAARLQSNDLSRYIEISEQTQALIAGFDSQLLRAVGSCSRERESNRHPWLSPK